MTQLLENEINCLEIFCLHTIQSCHPFLSTYTAVTENFVADTSILKLALEQVPTCTSHLKVVANSVFLSIVPVIRCTCTSWTLRSHTQFIDGKIHKGQPLTLAGRIERQHHSGEEHYNCFVNGTNNRIHGPQRS